MAGPEGSMSFQMCLGDRVPLSITLLQQTWELRLLPNIGAKEVKYKNHALPLVSSQE
jgi:hypothetical protein